MPAEYIVLSEHHVSETFKSHPEALSYCIAHQATLCKAVYRIVKPGVLGPLNVFGGFESQHMMEHIHRKEFSFTVI